MSPIIPWAGGDILSLAVYPFIRSFASGWTAAGQLPEWPLPAVNWFLFARTTLERWPCSCSVAQLCPTLGDPRDCSPPASSLHGIFQARTLEWVAISFSRGSSPPRDWTCVSCLAGRFFTTEPPGKPSDPFWSNTQYHALKLLFLSITILFLKLTDSGDSASVFLAPWLQPSLLPHATPIVKCNPPVDRDSWTFNHFQGIVSTGQSETNTLTWP